MLKRETSMTRLGAVLLLLAAARTGWAQDGPPVLDEKSVKSWVDFIRAQPDELKWEKLGWRTELGAAAQEAKALQRPILLWAMNGHPCGLT
jgi:hypothetical protein